ncbi:hypothetical protein [Psychrobacter aestuarii]|nr:hypothetical protein [Psychrobacter aestuarii]
MNTETPTEAANASAPVSEAPLDTDASDQNTPPTSMPSAPSASNTPKAYDAQIVSPAGYKTLRFGQDITAEIREQFGAKEPDTGDESCYYLSDNTLTYNSTEFGKRASVLYQIIDGKMALIHVQGPNAPFYNGVRVGDSVDSVMATHDGQLDYEVDHYAQNGDYYNLIANVNFTVVNPSKDGSVLTTDNIKMTNDTDTLPIQVEYHIKNGQKLSQNTIAADSWSAADKDKLVGEVDSIDIGIPEAIYLIEGCS